MGFQLCASLNHEGAALLKFKEAVDSDPYGALKNWDEGSMSPCSWFGVECSDDGRVMSHDLVSCPLLDSKRQVYRKKYLCMILLNYLI